MSEAGIDSALPFEVSRNNGKSLVRQIADGLRHAIVCGRYGPGSVLPSSREIERRLGVSRIVVKNAVARLVEEGLVVPRPRVGTLVRDRRTRIWRGHVVFVCADGYDNYLQAMMTGVLGDRLISKSYLFTPVCVHCHEHETADFSFLDAVLSQPTKLVVTLFVRPKIFRHLARKKIPYAFVGRLLRPPRDSVGMTRLDYNMAVPDFASACRRAGAGDVTIVYWYDYSIEEMEPALREQGMSVHAIKAEVDGTEGTLVGVKRAGRKTFERLIAEGKLRRDTLYFFADDYLADGALTAMLGAGIVPPRDVRIATWANRGLGPDYGRELSRMEMDPMRAGEIVAENVIEYLKTGWYPTSGNVVGPTWFDGETMWQKPCKLQERNRK